MSQIEYSIIPPNSILSAGSRYLKQKVIYYGDQRFITLDTYMRTPYVPDGTERVMVITKGAEYRPDLVSYDVYGFADNWWYIMETNGISDIMDFKAGTTIMLPRLL